MNPQVEAQAKPVVTPQATGAPALPKATQESQKPATNLQGDAKKEQDGKQVQPTPVPDYKSKIDSSLFDVEEGQENGLRTLNLTIKEAVLYLDEGKPTLAVLVTRDTTN
ncbi:hypothetical protein BEWA_040070 [Theileria equi strain WA]|uniref:Uncharacterized protein n=1 Tax=Theileria equi strain WA TaxID=1537102 RepID=L1LFB5_THEEQ|nr:hypothetical protein BEWA_040070 [Theileria equi strain WA]EKX73969.1 hypothetical protein BEWA_040070 [Theileria equi strain WA]|eukprot:XP_004833421.1 hypothetical protein BEWA_040070 [Theileria equi strain WA]